MHRGERRRSSVAAARSAIATVDGTVAGNEHAVFNTWLEACINRWEDALQKNSYSFFCVA